MQVEIGLHGRGALGGKPLDAAPDPAKSRVLDHLDRLRERLSAIGKGGDDADAVQEIGHRDGGCRRGLGGRQPSKTILLKTCSSKFWVPSSTSWLNEVVVVSVNLTVAPAPLFQSLLVMLQAPSASRVIVRWLRPPPSRTDGVGGVNLLGGPGLVLGGSAVGDLGPLHRPLRLAAVDLEDIAVALGIQEHERDGVGALAGVPPAPAVIQGERQLPGILYLVKGFGQGAVGLVGRKAGHRAGVVGGFLRVREHVPVALRLPAQGREVALGEIGVDDRRGPGLGGDRFLRRAGLRSCPGVGQNRPRPKDAARRMDAITVFSQEIRMILPSLSLHLPQMTMIMPGIACPSQTRGELP